MKNKIDYRNMKSETIAFNTFKNVIFMKPVLQIKYTKRLTHYTQSQQFILTQAKLFQEYQALLDFCSKIHLLKLSNLVGLDDSIKSALYDINTDYKKLDVFLDVIFQLHKNTNNFDKEFLNMLVGWFFITGRKSELYQEFFKCVCSYCRYNQKTYRKQLILTSVGLID